MIDASGTLGDREFTDAVGLGQALHDDPATVSCLANRLYAYAMGRAPSPQEDAVVAYVIDRFAESGYRFPDLMRAVASSTAFSRVSSHDRTASASSAVTVAVTVPQAD
jgi:hypothetical protein